MQKSSDNHLERAFDAAETFQQKLSRKWRKHTNRRTMWIVVIAGLFTTVLYVFVIQPPANFPAGDLVTVPKGSKLEVARTLKKDGIIRNEWAFLTLVVLTGRGKNVYAGDYIFKEPESMFSIARALTVGEYGLEPFRIRVPEGATVKDAARLFSLTLPRFNPADFLTKALPMEGYLFPDTYFFLPNATADTVISAMRQNFDNKEASIDTDIQASGHTLDEVVTMASIVEREARTTTDRRMIAGVLWNRIKRGMPLQSDVTLLYVVPKRDADLTLTDLKNPSPYNTYVTKGLPPTPVDNPSLDSIDAAAKPTKNEYLYYLADKNGITHYSKTYTQHLRYKAIYLGT